MRSVLDGSKLRNSGESAGAGALDEGLRRTVEWLRGQS